MAFSSNRGGFQSRPLREVSYGTAIAGAVSASALVLSCILSAVCLTLCLLGKAGGFLAAVAVPASVLVATPLCVLQVLMAIFGSKAIQREIGLRWVPWPDVGWGLGIGEWKGDDKRGAGKEREGGKEREREGEGERFFFVFLRDLFLPSRASHS